MHLALYPVLWWPVIALGRVAITIVAVWVYRDALVSQAGGWRVAAFGLRIAALLMALAALVRPALVFTETRKQSASLILLYDQSRSMLVADAWDGLPRWRAVEQTVKRS